MYVIYKLKTYSTRYFVTAFDKILINVFQIGSKIVNFILYFSNSLQVKKWALF